MKLKWNKTIRRIGIIAAIFCAIVAVIVYSGKKLNDYNEQYMKYNIDAMIAQNVETVTAIIQNEKGFIEAMSTDLSGRTNNLAELKRILNQRNKLKDIEHFLRIGFAYPDGTYYGSDGNIADISNRQYFKRSINGVTIVTDQFHDVIDNKKIVNVISAPVRNANNEVEGVVVGTFLNTSLEDILSKGYFAEIGSVAVIDDNGHIVAANYNSEFKGKHGDLLAYVSVDSGNNVSNAINGDKPNYMYFEKNGGLHLYSSPLKLTGYVNKLSVAVLINHSYMEEQLSFYKRNIHRTLAVVLVLALFAFGYYFVDVRKQQKQQQDELEKVAYVDIITGENNYAAFVKNVRKKNKSGYIIISAIGNFSVIQSHCGRKTADKLLQKVNSCLKRVLRYNDELGHINRDNFAIFIETEHVQWLERQFNLIEQYLKELAELEQCPSLAAYFGAAKFQKGDDVRELVSRARVALNSVLDSREENYKIYGEEYIEKFIENSNMEQNFQTNIVNKRFEVWYQPKYDPFTNSIMGAEALIRLRDETGKLVPPYKFIPLFESDGLIRPLDRYVFRTVCEMQKARLEAGLPTVPVSINLSRVSLHYPHIVEEYVEIMKQVGVKAKYVPLEITESATVNNRDICGLLDEFCKHGFKLHMDDFGSGYSSLASLNVLPFSTLKVDKSITDYIGEYSGNELIKHIVSLAKHLHMHVTVEGVETVEQVEFLKSINCHSIQGYFFSKPLEYKDFAQMLEEKEAKLMGAARPE